MAEDTRGVFAISVAAESGVLPEGWMPQIAVVQA